MKAGENLSSQPSEELPRRAVKPAGREGPRWLWVLPEVVAHMLQALLSFLPVYWGLELHVQKPRRFLCLRPQGRSQAASPQRVDDSVEGAEPRLALLPV